MSDELNFQGDVVVIYPADAGERRRGIPVLKGPKLVKLGDRMFISGKLLAPRTHWADGRHVHVALAEIGQMIEFEAEQDYRTGMERRRRRWWRWRFAGWVAGPTRSHFPALRRQFGPGILSGSMPDRPIGRSGTPFATLTGEVLGRGIATLGATGKSGLREVGRSLK